MFPIRLKSWIPQGPAQLDVDVLLRTHLFPHSPFLLLFQPHWPSFGSLNVPALSWLTVVHQCPHCFEYFPLHLASLYPLSTSQKSFSWRLPWLSSQNLLPLLYFVILPLTLQCTCIAFTTIYNYECTGVRILFVCFSFSNRVEASRKQRPCLSVYVFISNNSTQLNA